MLQRHPALSRTPRLARRMPLTAGASCTLPGMPSLELLHAIHTRGVDSTADVAATLGIDEADAVRQVREAEAAGLVVKERPESVRVPIDYDGGRLRLTAAGHVKKQTLLEERGGAHERR